MYLMTELQARIGIREKQLFAWKDRAEKAEARVAELEGIQLRFTTHLVDAHGMTLPEAYEIEEGGGRESAYTCSDCGEPKEANEPECGGRPDERKEDC